MKGNPLRNLEAIGQSLWLNGITKDMFRDNKLKMLINEDGLRGLTSNTSVLKKAISESPLYDIDIRTLTLERKDAAAIYETLSQRDIQQAADEFRPVYDNTQGRDGFVSLAVNPRLAYDTDGTVSEARRLWAALNRPNVLIQIPATDEGLPAIKKLISEGINVNASFLFGLWRYRQVLRAYIAGLDTRLNQGKPVSGITSVAGFILNKIDSAIDPTEDSFTALGGEQAFFALSLRGEVAVSTAKVAYKIFKKTFESELFLKMAERGAAPQRLMWAGTTPENKEYDDFKYFDALAGPDTINTATFGILQDYRNRGNPAPKLKDDLGQAYWVLSELPEIGINLDTIAEKLEKDAIAKAVKTYDKLIEAIAKKAAE